MSDVTNGRERRGIWALRDRPGIVWLTLAVVVAALHHWIPAWTWLMVHLLLLGAVTHSIMVWTAHFAQALLKTPPGLDDRRIQSRRLVLLLVGTLLVLAGVPLDWWPVTVAGAGLVSSAVLWHGIQLTRRLRRALPARFRITVRYYIAATLCLPVGATFGALLARGGSDTWSGRLIVAHTMTMVLGWVGLTILGTLVTLWPTMLRTRMDDRAEALAGQALPVLLAALAIVVVAALTGPPWTPVLGLLAYLGAGAWWARALVRPARTAPPRAFATVSVTSGLVWFAASVGGVALLLLRGTSWAHVADDYTGVAVMIAVGGALQVLLGALSYLIPSVLGGGPSVVRAGQAWFDRWATVRLAVANVGLAVCLSPVPGPVRLFVGALVLVAFGGFIPLMTLAIRACVQARRALLETVSNGATTPTPRNIAGIRAPGVWSQAEAAAGLAALLVAVLAGVLWSPSFARPAAATVAATGHTTSVSITAVDMHFTPDTISVPRGDRLVIDLTNADETTTHDLWLSTGQHTARLRPGAHAVLDAGVIGGPVDGWCSVVGHRQLGMTLHILARGAPGTATGSGSAPSPSSAGVNLHQRPDSGFRAVDAVLPPIGPGRVHAVTLTVKEVELQVAPGVWQRRWTYNGSVPGPTLHGRVGDTFVVTLVNDGSMGHSIDFHAGDVAPDGVMRTIPPGSSLVYRFTANRSGIWLYHCSTMPMSAHIAAGMFGAVVIDPPGLAPVDASYLLIQSDDYLGPDRTAGHAAEVNAPRAAAATPDVVTFNGVANQYDHAPLTARVGQRVRIWVLDAGPNLPLSFHVVGGQFDTVYAEGAYLLRPGAGGGTGGTGGSQVLGLQAAQGGFVEMTFPQPGRYSIVNHIMAFAEMGAHGALVVTP